MGLLASAMALILALAGSASGMARSGTARLDPPPTWRPHVLARYPHDPRAFTQGLLVYRGYFYESTGLYGESSLRKVVPATGVVVDKIDVPETYFAEGLARVGDKLLQITWKENVAFQYDLVSLKKEAFFKYDGEGWGLCLDESHPGGAVLYMSDGSSTLTLRDPISFAPLSQITVTVSGEPRDNLNELECVGDSVYANVWYTDQIMRIDKMTGEVTAVIDASGLLPEAERVNDHVLNGIAYDPVTQHFFVTGKMWPALFEVEWEGPGVEPTPVPTPPAVFLPIGWKRR